MIGEHASTTMTVERLPGAAPFAFRSSRNRAIAHPAALDARSIAINVLLSSLYAIFVYANIKFFLQTGSLVSAGLVLFNAIAMLFFLVRRRASDVTESVPKRAIACATFLLPYAMRPVASVPWTLVVPSMLGQVAGLALMIASLIVLGRSIGIVAANRGVKSGGPYAWVRHPMYAGEIVFLMSFLFSNWTPLNAVVVCAILAGQVIRLSHEEALLLRDRAYLRYRNAVPYRLVPWLF